MKSAIASHQDVFLGCFNEDVRNAIVEYGKLIREKSGDYDVIIFMARKSVCLAESMRILKLTTFQTLAISHRVLDMNTEWLRNKRVAIFDDALITGTTIFRAKNKLMEVGCVVDVYVLCVSEPWWVKELVDPEKPYLVLSEGECASLCADIVDAISLVPIPYSTDYPAFISIRLQKEQLDGLLTVPMWNVNDVSSNIQSRQGIFSKTFEPSADALPDLWGRFGRNLESGNLLKLRLYARPFYHDNTTYWCSLLPIFAINPMTKEQIDKVFSFLVEKFGDEGNALSFWFSPSNNACAEEVNSRYKAKLRLIQFLAAHNLAEYWIDTIKSSSGLDLHYRTSDQLLRYLFPEPVIQAIQNSQDSIRSLFHENCELTSQAINNVPIHPIRVGEIYREDAWSVENILTTLFIDLYENFELKTRKLIKEQKLNVFDEDGSAKAEYEKYILRLERGFSLLDMIRSLGGYKWSNEKSLYVISKFLDRMIDRGVVVPSTCVVGDVVYRGYRHGEDVNFADGEKYALHKMLEAYTSDRGIDYLSGLEVEKLSVLTLKKMLDAGYFTRPDKNILGQNNTIGVRFSLHGAVVSERSSKIYDAPVESCIRNILVDSNVLDTNAKPDVGEKGRFYVRAFPSSQRPLSSIREEALLEADTIGSLLGGLRKRARERGVQDKLKQEEMTLLATITDTKDLCGALAAEVKFVMIGLRGVKASVGDYLAKQISGKAFLTFLRDKSNNHMFTALHSAHWKYTSWSDAVIWTVIDRVHKGLTLTNRRDANTWKRLWPESMRQNPKSDKLPLIGLVRRLAVWLYYSRFYYSLIEIGVRINEKHNSDTEHQDSWDKIIAELHLCHDSLLALIDKPIANIQKIVSSVERNSWEGVSLINLSVNALDAHTLEAEDLLTRVDLSASSYGEIQKTLDYANILVIALPHHNYKAGVVKKHLMEVIEKSKLLYHKENNVSEFSLRILQSDSHDIKNAIVVAGYRTKEIKYFVELIGNILSDRAIDAVSFIMFCNMDDSSHLFCSASNNEVYGKLLWNRVNAVIDYIDRSGNGLTYSGEMHLVTEKNDKLSSIFSSSDREKAQNLFRSESKTPVIIQDTLIKPVSMYRLAPAWSYVMSEIIEDIDVGIMAVVSDEYRAVKDHLMKYPGFRDNIRNAESTRRFCFGSLPAANSKWHKVVCSRPLKQGNEPIMPVYEELRRFYRPRLMVLVGIAGKVHSKLKVCDVSIGNVILDYDKRADLPSGVEHTFNPLPALEPWLQDLYNQMEEQFGEDIYLQSAPGSPGGEFKVTLGPIGSGGAVVKDEESEIREWLNLVSRKTTVVETEAVGVAEQYSNSKLLKKDRTKGYLVIRGISDNADVDKNKEYRYVPAANAMIALDSLLKNASMGFEEEI